MTCPISVTVEQESNLRANPAMVAFRAALAAAICAWRRMAAASWLVTTATTSANGYGTFTVASDGTWTYTLDNTNATVQALNTDSAPLSDSFVVTTADGTTKTVTVSIAGANDAATRRNFKVARERSAPLRRGTRTRCGAVPVTRAGAPSRAPAAAARGRPA